MHNHEGLSLNGFGRTLRLVGAFTMSVGLLAGVRGSCQANRYAELPPAEVIDSPSFQGTNAEAAENGDQMEALGIGIFIGGVVSASAGIIVMRRYPESDDPTPLTVFE